jgi:ligand-binding sensor domain-containing protein
MGEYTFSKQQISNAGRIFGRKLRLFFLIALGIAGALPAYSQTQSSTFVQVAPEVLSNSFIRCFYKDSKGYMWIGTEDALIRYDGSKAHRYIHDTHDNQSVAHSSINIIAEGSDNKLWIGTAQGLCIYDREHDNFINVDSIDGNLNYLNNRYITDLEFDSHGNLWIGTHEGGINIYDPVRQEFSYIVDPPQAGIMPSTNFINVLLNMGDTMWCASKGGLLLYDTRTKKRLPLNSLNRFSDAQISSIVREKSGDLLIATVMGKITKVVQRDGKYSFRELLSGTELGEGANRVLTMCLDHRSNILIGGENSGYNFLEKPNYTLHRFPADEGNAKRLPTNAIQTIYADDLGLIWIGTLNNGVFIVDNNDRKFETSELSAGNPPFENEDVRSFAEDRIGNIWVASYGVGLGKINATTNVLQCVHEVNQKISNKNITSLLCDRNGYLWLGTAGKGVFRVNPQTYQLDNFSLFSEGFGNDQVFCLYEDKGGTLWAGTWGSGLFFFDKNTNKFASCTEYDQANHIPNTAYISDMLEDSDGTFWVGTLYGLYELKKRAENSFSYRVHLRGQHKRNTNSGDH